MISAFHKTLTTYTLEIAIIKRTFWVDNNVFAFNDHRNPCEKIWERMKLHETSKEVGEFFRTACKFDRYTRGHHDLYNSFPAGMFGNTTVFRQVPVRRHRIHGLRCLLSSSVPTKTRVQGTVRRSCAMHRGFLTGNTGRDRRRLAKPTLYESFEILQAVPMAANAAKASEAHPVSNIPGGAQLTSTETGRRRQDSGGKGGCGQSSGGCEDTKAAQSYYEASCADTKHTGNRSSYPEIPAAPHARVSRRARGSILTANLFITLKKP